jgi:hypothetical protein
MGHQRQPWRRRMRPAQLARKLFDNFAGRA